MRGVSRTSHAEAAERLEALLDRTPGAEARTQLGSDLFGVVDLLDSSVPLRRAVTDPSRDGESKAGLLARLLSGKVSPDAADLLSGAARARWSAAHDLADSVEILAVDTVLASAESSNRLDQVEEDVHRAGQILTTDQGVRSALLDRRASTKAKSELVGRLVSGTASETSTLVRRMASHPRGRRPEAAFEFVTQAAARRRERLVAHVSVATWPTEEQQQRLAAALTQKYGRQVRLAIDVDTEVLGGMRVQIGDDVIDGTVSRRLDEASEQLGR